MNAIGPMKTALLIDELRKIFKVSRQAFVDPAILEVSGPRSSTNAGSISVTVPRLPSPAISSPARSAAEASCSPATAREISSAMLNTCPHRGAQVCREKHGSAKSFQCFYHGWVFGLDGTLRSQPGETSYAEDFKERSTSNMQQVPRLRELPRFEFHLFRQECREASPIISARSKNISM